MNRWSEKKQKNRIKTQFGKNPMDMENWESLQLRMYEIEMYEQRRRKTFNQEWVDDVTWNDLEMDRVFARIIREHTWENRFYIIGFMAVKTDRNSRGWKNELRFFRVRNHPASKWKKSFHISGNKKKIIICHCF